MVYMEIYRLKQNKAKHSQGDGVNKRQGLWRWLGPLSGTRLVPVEKRAPCLFWSCDDGAKAPLQTKAQLFPATECAGAMISDFPIFQDTGN